MSDARSLFAAASDEREGGQQPLVQNTLPASVQYRNVHKTFFSNLQLALSVGWWVALFGLFVYCPVLNEFVFGEAVRNGIGSTICAGNRPARLGKNIISAVPADGLVAYTGDEAGWNPKENSEQVWCGHLPKSFESFWPNVVQMIVFTVYRNTGTTVQLAWQGCCGTACAVLNILIMGKLFPSGALQMCSLVGFVCRADQMEYVDLNFATWGYLVAWFDVLFILFLFLISNASENTIKFGMSWHIYFMMVFMDPRQGYHSGVYPGVPDSEPMIVVYTVILGASVAIFATMLPCWHSLLNISKVDDDSIAAVAGLKTIWTDAIDYFCGSQQTPRRYQIQGKILLLSETVTRIQGNLAASWWETFNLCGFKRRRQLYKMLDMTIAELHDLMFAVKSSVHHEDFGGDHKRFCAGMLVFLLDVENKASHILELVAESAKDGQIDVTEQEKIGEAKRDLEQAQSAMLQEYLTQCHVERGYSPFISRDLGNEVLFAFALAVFGKRVAELCTDLNRIDAEPETHGCGLFLKSFFNGLCATWSREALTNSVHVQFAFRNWVGITICFLLGYNMDNNVFKPYTSIMPSTLALLIAHFSGSALKKDLHRLLGLALGKVLPILLISLLSWISCGSQLRTICHFIIFFAYITGFTYMYYASKHYSTEGCLIAGFGCFPLLSRCVTQSDESAMFALRYHEITAVTTAIMVQLIVDCVFDCGQAPRDLVIETMYTLGEEVSQAFDAFFDSDIDRMHVHIGRAKRAHSLASSLSVEADPGLEVAPGLKTPFRIRLVNESLDKFQHIVSDLRMLALAVAGWQPISTSTITRVHKGQHMNGSDSGKGDCNQSLHIAEFLNSKPAMGMMKSDLLNSLGSTLDNLHLMLCHADESQIETVDMKLLESTPGLRQLDGTIEIKSEINIAGHVGEEHLQRAQLRNDQEAAVGGDSRTLVNDLRARLTVALATLASTVRHISDISELIVKENAY